MEITDTIIIILTIHGTTHITIHIITDHITDILITMVGEVIITVITMATMMAIGTDIMVLTITMEAVAIQILMHMGGITEMAQDKELAQM